MKFENFITTLKKNTNVRIGTMYNPLDIITTEGIYYTDKDCIKINPFIKNPYCTILHELAHATGVKKRLNRFNRYHWLNLGDIYINMEEAIADKAAKTIMEHLEIPIEKSQLAYIEFHTQSAATELFEAMENAMTKLECQKYIQELVDLEANKIVRYIKKNWLKHKKIGGRK